MDLSLSYPLLDHHVVLFASLSIILLIFYNLKKSSPANLKLPPGKTGWPIIGESLEYALAGQSGNPEKFINDRMQKHSPYVFQTSLFGQKMAVFCGPAGNKFLFANDNKLVTNWYAHSIEKLLLPSCLCDSSLKLLSPIMHKTLSEFLKPKSMQSYVAIMDSMARQHVHEEWEPNNEVKVASLSKDYSFAVACQLFMSIDPKLVAKVAHLFGFVSDGLISVPINFPGTAFNRAIKASKIIFEELAAIIKQRKLELSEKNEESACKDVLTSLLLYTDENGKFMNDMQIATAILGLLVASHDTTSALMTLVVNHLAESPDIYNKVLKEQMEIMKSKRPNELLNREDIQKMKYSLCVANETMRLTPPSPGFFKEAITDFTYAGFNIPKGWKVLIYAHWTTYSTHKNPIYFPSPEKFDPSRFEGNGPAPNTFVPFGGGIRMCPGREYARVETLVYMHNLVTKFKWEKGVVSSGDALEFFSRSSLGVAFAIGFWV
ncbi:hypothetical protein L1049_028610 [Liquidambar formosana]|uniref:Cytochrome P450 n=1 Tax=Liquidambar formosana TaxID=63359 RepID=A0AAP0N897_LIQFO